MKARLGDVRRRIISEITHDFAKRLTTGLCFVAGPSYEERRFLCALETKDLERGTINVVAAATYYRSSPKQLKNGDEVTPCVIDSLFATSPGSSLAIMQVLFSLCKSIVPPKSSSPAAQKFIKSYYEKNIGSGAVVPLDDGGDVPWLSAVYFDPGYVDGRSLLERSASMLAAAAHGMNVSMKELRNEIFNAQDQAFRSAYRSKASGRKEVLLALSGGEPTVEKLNACTRTDNYEALVGYLEQLTPPLPADIVVWLKKKSSMLRSWGGFDDALDRLVPGFEGETEE